MTDNTKFDALDRRALDQWDPGFVVNDNGTNAVFIGELQIEIVRPSEDRYEMTITFPTEQNDFKIKMSRARTLEEFKIKTSES